MYYGKLVIIGLLRLPGYRLLLLVGMGAEYLTFSEQGLLDQRFTRALYIFCSGVALQFNVTEEFLCIF